MDVALFDQLAASAGDALDHWAALMRSEIERVGDVQGTCNMALALTQMPDSQCRGVLLAALLRLAHPPAEVT